MKTFIYSLFLICGLLAHPGLASSAPPIAPILPKAYLGWEAAYQLKNEVAEAVLIPAIGRLVYFSTVDGQNPFRLDASLLGQIPPAGDPFFNIGGDWLWPVSQARWPAMSEGGSDWPPPPVLADLPWDCSAWMDTTGAKCARLSREYGAPLHIKVVRLFRLEPASSRLVIQQQIERTAASDIPVVLWNISQIANAEQIAMPVAEQSLFPGGLTALMGGMPGKDRLTTCGDVKTYRVLPGSETKLGSDSDRSWIAATQNHTLIFETAQTTHTGDAYPDGGCVVELYSNEGLGYSEIETLSPEVYLQPGRVLDNTLTIQLKSLDAIPDACELAEQVRQLAGESPAPVQSPK